MNILYGAALLALTASFQPAEALERRAPAQITIQPRSGLDAGTEVLPDSQSYHYYATQPGLTALGSTDYGVSHHSNLPGRFEGGKPFPIDIPAPADLMR